MHFRFSGRWPSSTPATFNRDAEVGVMVFAHAAQAPLAGKSLRVFPGNRLLVVWEPEANGDLAVEVASQLARTLAIGAEGDETKINRRGLADRLAKLHNVIDRADQIKRGIASARAASMMPKTPTRT